MKKTIYPNLFKPMKLSGAAMIVVENASITAGGSGSPRTIRKEKRAAYRELFQ